MLTMMCSAAASLGLRRFDFSQCHPCATAMPLPCADKSLPSAKILRSPLDHFRWTLGGRSFHCFRSFGRPSWFSFQTIIAQSLLCGAVVSGNPISALCFAHALAFSAMRNVCFGYLCHSLLPEPAPPVAFITGTYEAAAGRSIRKDRFPQAEAFSFSD